MRAERYHCEDEVGRLVENFFQWGGDGAAVLTSASLWARLVREVRRGSAPVAIVGVDAGYTASAFKAIGEALTKTLCTYHVSSLTIEMQARDILRIAQSTYRRRLERAHLDFMRAYHEARRASKL
jgi:hypothetical protein